MKESELAGLVEDLLEQNISETSKKHFEEILIALEDDVDTGLKVGRIREILARLQTESLPADLQAEIWNFSAALDLL